MATKTPKVPVDDYFATVHAGVCETPDSLVEIQIDEKTVPGVSNVTGNTVVWASDRNFRGGDKKNGGISGALEVLFGAPGQQLSANYAGQLRDENDAPLAPATAPGYLGFLSVVFRGATLVEAGAPPAPNSSLASVLSPYVARLGFLWGSNNPTIPPFRARVRKHPQVLNATLRVIEIDGYRHANPACVLYDLCTRRAGISPGNIDTASFDAAAQTLFDEGFGISFVWLREKEVSALIKEIEDHVNGIVYNDPSTGLISIQLLRDNYTAATLDTYGVDNFTMTDFERRTRDDLINVLTVTYRNAKTQDDESVTVADEAGIAMNAGREVRASKSYPYVRNATLAARLAERDLRTGATPLARGSIAANRSMADIRPGDVFLLSYPLEFGAETIVVRALKVDRGAPGAMRVQIDWAEDLFTSPVAGTTTRLPSLAPPISAPPAPLDYRAGFSAPYAIAARVPEITLSDDNYPDAVVALLGDQSASDAQGFLIVGRTVSPAGNVVFEELGTVPLSDRVTLQTNLVAEANTATVSIAAPDRQIPVRGDFMVIGETEATSELILINSDPVYGPTVTFSALRGVLDTVPRAWPAGAPGWLISQNFSSWDVQPRVAGAPTTYDLLPRTSRGVLPADRSVDFTYTPLDRAYTPARPANAQIDGVAFGTKVYATDPANVPVSWSTRNRISEDSIVLAWDAASVSPETGQTTRIDITDISGAPVSSQAMLVGSSINLPLATFGGRRYYDLTFRAERNGLTSFQGHKIRIDFSSRVGYGSDYGSGYGD